jgi:uncharacterized protein YggE
MKHCLIVSVILLTITSWSIAAEKQTDEKKPVARTISVSGSAISYIPADTILWTVTLQTSANDVAEAKVLSDTQVKELVEVCAKKSIPAQDISAGLFKIQDTRLEENAALRNDSGKLFAVTRIATIRQKDPTIFPDMLSLLSKAKGIKVRYNIVSSKTDQITKETMVKATEAAKNKATAMVTSLGAQLGKVISINEYPPIGWNIPESNVPVDQSSAVFAAEAEKVRITVYVTFEIE